MSAAAFDTLTAARDLEAAGIERRQAEAIAGTVRTAAADRDALATKADLAELRADLAEHRAATTTDLAELEARLTARMDTFATKADLAGVRSELGTIRWSVGLIAAFLFAIGLRVFGLI